MNKKNIMSKKINALNLLDYKDKSKRNCVKIWKGNTDKHELVKFLICQKLIKQGYDTYTEAGSSGWRADIFAISPQGDIHVIEILNSETNKMYDEKLNKYPLEIIMNQVRVKGFDIKEWEL